MKPKIFTFYHFLMTMMTVDDVDYTMTKVHTFLDAAKICFSDAISISVSCAAVVSVEFNFVTFFWDLSLLEEILTLQCRQLKKNHFFNIVEDFLKVPLSFICENRRWRFLIRIFRFFLSLFPPHFLRWFWWRSEMKFFFGLSRLSHQNLNFPE